jgi:cobalt/nickel transport system permease protein
VLLLWLVAIFALSAVRNPRVLAAGCLLAPLLAWRHAWRVARRVGRLVLPPVMLLVLGSCGWLRLVEGSWPDPLPYAALALRALLIAWISFAVMARVDLVAAVAPWPAASRLLVIALAQIHALRLLATESWQGLRSRLPRKPRAADAVRGAGGLTGALFTLATRNARDVTDAMRSRGF